MSELVPIPGTIFLKTLVASATPQRSVSPRTQTRLHSTFAGMVVVGLEIISGIRSEESLSQATHAPAFQRYVRRMRSEEHSKARGLVKLRSFHAHQSWDKTYEVFGVATFSQHHLGFVGNIGRSEHSKDPQIMYLRVLE